MTDRPLPHFLAALPAVAVLAMVLVLGTLRAPAPPAEQLPCARRGALDTPAEMVAEGIAFPLSGWAHDRYGVREIRVVSDGRVVARARTGTPRPDVAAALGGCRGTGRAGFGLMVPAGSAPLAARDFQVLAVNGLGQAFPVGRVTLRFARPLGYLDSKAPIRWDGADAVSGWAIAPGGPVRVSVLAGARELVRGRTEQPREDVHRIFRDWPEAARAGFRLELPLGSLPRGRYPLALRFEAADGARTEIAGPEVINDAPLGKVVSAADRYADPQAIVLEAWVFAEDAIEAVTAETEAGIPLGALQRVPGARPPADFRPAGVAVAAGAVYRARVDTRFLPGGVHRVMVRVADGQRRSERLPGPLLRAGGLADVSCPGTVRRLFYPGNHRAFRQGFPQMLGWRELAAGGCLEVGIRGRVEYLRTTLGRGKDYRFAPDFPDAGRLRNGREMTGVSLRHLLDLAKDLKAPLLITLDGGIWAGMSFADPEIDVVDLLKQDERAVQWNQHGRSEAADALRGLAGSLDDPLLARMMSLNRFNQPYRDYKKRNLQAAVREIVRFGRAHPEVDITVNLDPDVYINPWSSLVQWYDYNPDALRQFREWLFHLGPYADGGELAHARHEPRLTLAQAGRLAGRTFGEIDAVEPPRETIDYGDPWQQIWSHFRRHLVAQHYADLAAWAAEAGLPRERIYSAQAFIQADVAVGVRARATGWTDQAGVSIEGARPPQGHLGTTLYGPASRNLGRPRSGRSLIDNLRGVDPHWGAVEFHPAVIALPKTPPTHGEAYRTLLEIVNGGARFLSPMWGSRAEDQRLNPAGFRAYDLMEGSAFEYQLGWWSLQLRTLPAGELLFPFGNDAVDSLDGWTAAAGVRARAGRGQVLLDGDAIHFASPGWDGIRTGRQIVIEVAGAWPQRTLKGTARLGGGGRLSCEAAAPPLRCVLPVAPGDSLRQVVLEWTGAGASGGVALDAVRVAVR